MLVILFTGNIFKLSGALVQQLLRNPVRVNIRTQNQSYALVDWSLEVPSNLEQLRFDCSPKRNEPNKMPSPTFKGQPPDNFATKKQRLRFAPCFGTPPQKKNLETVLKGATRHVLHVKVFNASPQLDLECLGAVGVLPLLETQGI